ncbi:methyltransferase domain-containing protein [Streptomyces sp. NBC_01275]|uniref:methyltransferase domain-containing protein n=1 Tax=Streptomyces sp. NBC_01275 TaxID=2903807 RepID=UPI00224E7266|nr:methyltransferase domain-containing protein [Streptomyces sp. NBC_01275]MCX4763631.1 methyltransferase domain-containing protein [Streptomyces sp. NBC_01275]
MEFEVIHRDILPGVLEPGSRILDVGSGPGRHAVALAARGHRLALADLSAACLAEARRRFDEAGLTDRLLDVQHTSATDLSVQPGAFDAVLLFGPLYHLVDDAAAAECMRRAVAALRPGGHLFATFLTRTSIVRDLLKRGRFAEIQALIDNGYLTQGRYRPLSEQSRADYMPPVRTHGLAEAERLVRDAGLETVDVHSLEGAAGWMRPYIDEVGADDASFRELSAVVRATARLPELIEAGDHFVITARRPGAGTGDGAARVARPAAEGRHGVRTSSSGAVTGRHRTLVAAEEGRICFAPSVVTHAGRRLIAMAVGAADDRVFTPIQHTDRAPEPWYTGGRNRIRVMPLSDQGSACQDEGVDIPVPPAVEDMTGASLVSVGDGLHLWFGARAAGGPWRIHHTVSADGGRTWSPPELALEQGPSGSGDCEHVLLPAVVHRRDGWWMWYAGRDGAHRRIHLARSADGTNWQRHGVAIELGTPGSADAYATDCPAVVSLPNGGFLALYGAGSSRSLAGAVSEDGLTWRKIGPVLHRGEHGAPDSRYAFYPALLHDGTGSATLLYAGEDHRSRWTILSAGVVDLALLAARPEPLSLSGTAADSVAFIREDVDESFLDVPEDCHGPAPVYRSRDGLIRQLRPSSTPVFAVRSPSGERDSVVVKLGRGRASVEREFDGLQGLTRHLPLPTAALHYQGEQAALVMEHLEGAPLSALAATDSDRFDGVLRAVVTGLADTASATLTPAADVEGGADHTLQSPEVVSEWLEGIGDALAPWRNHRLSLNGTLLDETLGDTVRKSRALIRRDPEWLVHSSGDVHLGNVHVAPDGERWWLLDLEFAGLHDLDRTVAGLLGSCLKHSGLITDARAEVGPGELSLTVGIRGDLGHRLLNTPYLLDLFAELPLDSGRVFAFLLPDLYFRLTATADGDAVPAFGLAALALGARMTRQGQGRGRGRGQR